MRSKTVIALAVLALLTVSHAVQAAVTLYSPPAGDGTYSWNSKYGPYGYDATSTTMGVGLYMGGQYGNDYTVSIFEIPISPLAGQNVTSATLVVDALDFGTYYYYGSASIGWLDTGATVLTGDIIADNLGPVSTNRPSHFQIYNSDYPYAPGLKYFDVLSFVQADLAAGRAFSTFVMSGSRDTSGSIYTAESGRGPRIIAEVPEPASMLILASGAVGLLVRRRRSV